MAKAKSRKPAAAANRTLHAGLPRVPTLYGLKPRKQYLPFSHAEQRLERSRNYWICTTRPDGRPHAMPVWGIWLEDAFYFSTARASRKGRNIARNSAVSVHLESADDLVALEGKAREVSDEETITRLNAAYRAKYQMPLWIHPENAVFCVHPRVVFAWTEKNFPKDATRWEFPATKNG
ncbi:MAG: pyridoxamine 5'-phosphate oxidase family protein [Acidobacteriota bacterium]|nr:pyridoxamine 5'-phosphate oxidase family protein [Acidobacteriota bacterium]